MQEEDKSSFYTPGNLTVSYLAVFLVAAVLYIVSCAPGVLWQDSGMFQYRIWHNDIEGELGLALSHPLYLIIGMGVKYIPLGGFAYRVNLISAVTAAFTIANLFLLMRLWLHRILPAVIAAVTLALSHTMWLHASVAEVYTLYTALFTAELVFLLQYLRSYRVGYLYLLGLFNGLAIANHMWGIIAFICYLVFLIALLIKKQINLKHFGIIAALWLIGAAPYEYLIIKDIIETGDFTATIASAFFGNSWRADVLNTSLSAKIIKENFILIAYNFPTPNAIFFFAGLYGLRKASPNVNFANILLALLILFFVFAFRYTVPDRYAFFMPFYCLAAVMIGVGIHLFFKQYSRKEYAIVILVFALLPLVAYKFVPVAAEKMRISLGTKRTIPYRDNYIWFLRPWKTFYNGPEQFANDVFDTVEENSVIYADSTTVPPLLYLQEVEQKRSDVKVISNIGSSKDSPEFNEGTVTKLLAEGAVYVVCPVKGYCPDFLLERYDFVSEGIIWRVVKKEQNRY